MEFAASSAISARKSCLVALSLEPMNSNEKSRHRRAYYVGEKINAVMNRLKEKVSVAFDLREPDLLCESQDDH
jgi:hypothetical protein